MGEFFKLKKSIAVIVSICLVMTGCFAGISGSVVFAEDETRPAEPTKATKSTEPTKATESTESAKPDESYKDGEVIVVFEDQVDKKEAETVVDKMDGEDVEVLKDDNEEVTALVELPKDQSVEEAIDEYESNADVAYVQPNYEYSLAGQSKTASNDDLYSKLWHFDKVFPEGAWGLVDGVASKKVKVAVIDTGVATTHKDLQKNLNKGLCADTSSGTKTVALKGDDNGHGTHVTGIIGATANNSIGVAGVGSGSKNSLVDIFVVDVFKKSGVAYTDGVVRGINYAKNKGAKVINLSLGHKGSAASKSADKYMKTAIDSAVKKGATVVCAAGNNGNAAAYYPSDFKSCISVISTNKNNTRSGFSNYGSKKDISAPGSEIWSTIPGSKYDQYSGTSMAAPVVSGTAAMVYAANPNLTPSQVKKILYTTATDLGTAGKDKSTGYGNVNAKAAVKKAIATRDVTSVSLKSLLVSKGAKGKLSATVKPKSAVNKKVTWVSSNPGTVSVDTSGNVTGQNIGKAQITATSKSNPSISGSCTVTVGYKVSYVLNGGKNHSSNPAVYDYEKTVKLKNPKRAGYTFEGWYADSEYSEQVTDLSGKNYKLYAKWKKVAVKKTGITSLKRTSPTKIKVTYQKVEDAKGYQIKYSRNKNFKSGTSKTVSTTAVSKTLSGLKKNKKYYVKVRAYKLDSAGKKVYSKYCSVKSK